MEEALQLGRELGIWLGNLLLRIGVPEESASLLKTAILIVVVIGLVFLIDLVVNKLLMSFVKKVASRTKTTFDDHLVQRKATDYLGHILPAVFVDQVIPIVFHDYSFLINPLKIAVDVYIYILIVQFIQSILRGTRDFLLSQEQFKDKPIQAITQLFVILSWIVVVILIFSELTDKSVTGLLTGLGALSAVTLLVFKDSILGFVGSIQLAYNDMVRVGDWIEVEKYGANGMVEVINLNTVKVRNWDNTTTNIPTYALMADSFRNYRSMTEGEVGRQIARSVTIKQSSIRFLNNEDIDRLKKIELIRDYLEERQKEINEFNKQSGADKSIEVNGRQMTNIGVFRKYLELYLRHHPKINKEGTLMTRQLHPSDKGIPIQIYTFASDKRWVFFEGIMSDIFDHALASVKYFDLDIFEAPTGSDLRAIAEAKN